MFDVTNFKNKIKNAFNDEEKKEFIKKFEKEYEKYENKTTEDIFDQNINQTLEERNNKNEFLEKQKDIIEKVVDAISEDLVNETALIEIDNEELKIYHYKDKDEILDINDFNEIENAIKPDLTSRLYRKHIKGKSYEAALLYMYKYLKTGNKKMYDNFRVGLDSLDLDNVLYRIIDKNPNQISYYLPRMHKSIIEQGFFKIPKTKIIKVPLALLQMTRLDYETLSPVTLMIADEYTKKIFKPDMNKTYVIKTGIFSSKFNFRNAKIEGNELNDLGQYFIYIHNIGIKAASFLMSKTMYGMATTTDWVMREYIPPKEDLGKIYHGLDLRCEYRVFVDFDKEEILGISPYWKEDILMENFKKKNTETSYHDAVIYQLAKERLNELYDNNNEKVLKNIKELLKIHKKETNETEKMNGQWSIDIMQNGDDFYIIDMALRRDSALSECVTKELNEPNYKIWIE